LIKNEISHVQHWCVTHKMQLNNEKTKIMQLNSTPTICSLDLQCNFKDLITCNLSFLGYTINEHLTWAAFINNILKKLAYRIHILRVLKNTLTKENLINIYYAYFHTSLQILHKLA
jgi:hypothetical protein